MTDRLPERAADPRKPLTQDVSVDLGCSEVCMTQQILHSSDIVSLFQQLCCKGVPEGVTARPLANPGSISSECPALGYFRARA